jgi:hypothetical protein
MLLNLTQPGNKFMMGYISKVLYLMIFLSYILFYVTRSNKGF